MNEPPGRGQNFGAGKNDAVVVHRGSFDRKSIWEAEYDVEENDRGDGNCIDAITPLAHPYSCQLHTMTSSQSLTP